jgi:hypothetical protein
MIIEKSSLMLLKAIMNAIIAKYLSPTKYDLIIIKLSKVAMRPWMKKVTNLCLKPYPMFEFGQGKNNGQVMVGNIFVFEKKLETIGAAQRKYMNHQAKKNIV